MRSFCCYIILSDEALVEVESGLQSKEVEEKHLTDSTGNGIAAQDELADQQV